MVLSHSGFSGLKRPHLDWLLVELRGPWEAKVQGQRRERRPRASRPGRIHDQTAIKSEGINGLLADYPDVAIEMNNGYRGLARDYPGQVTAPPKKPRKNAAEAETQTWREARHAQSSSRICVEHGIGELKA